jgi:hypothetical protein
MKKTLSIVAIGLNFLISQLDTLCPHFDIPDANIVHSKLEKICVENLPFKDNTDLLPLLADITSMFDQINASMVKESLDWLFEKIKQIKRTDRLSVNFTDRTARFGRTYGDDFEMKFQEINDIIKFTIGNNYVNIGKQFVALQIRGLPQGAPISPPLARLVCIMQEKKAFDLVGSDCRLFSGMRYVDDVFILFFFAKNDPKTFQKAQELFVFFQTNCYTNMFLKLGDTNTSYDFLSTSSTWENGRMSIKWLNKNEESLKNKAQRIVRFVHSKSFTPRSTKRGAIYAQFLRVARNSDSRYLLEAFDNLTAEYKLLGYRDSFVKEERKKVESQFLETCQP